MPAPEPFRDLCKSLCSTAAAAAANDLGAEDGGAVTVGINCETALPPSEDEVISPMGALPPG